MKKIDTCLILCVLSLLFGCGNSRSTSFDNSIYAIFMYDGGKEIVLYSNHTASVNGQSGSWSENGIMDIPYEINYGSKACCISTTKGMIFWGNMCDAVDNLHNEDNWITCHQKR